MKDFEYAYSLLEARACDPRSDLRDPLFQEILSSFGSESISIFQVGAIESLDAGFRVGSGWSDVIFGEHIKKHGGQITVVDIDLDHLAHSVLMASGLGYKIQPIYGDAVGYIKEGHDLYYLDGADETQDTKIGGNKQTLEQFKKIEHTKSVVMVDDAKTKAVELIEHLNEKEIAFTTHEIKMPHLSKLLYNLDMPPPKKAPIISTMIIIDMRENS